MSPNRTRNIVVLLLLRRRRRKWSRSSRKSCWLAIGLLSQLNCRLSGHARGNEIEASEEAHQALDDRPMGLEMKL